jgi:23S rRNA (adenine2503-C2)-methyltransferase
MGFLRNLRAGEIIEQVIWVARALQQDDRPFDRLRASPLDTLRVRAGRTTEDERNDRKSSAVTRRSSETSGATNNSEHLSNVVFMGMGEPFANYANVIEATRRLIEPKEGGGFGLGARKLTISTVGLVPGIRKFADEGMQVNLAVSLHAATDELRSQLVPINQRFPLREVTKAVRDYIMKTNRRVSFEWALIDSVNDTPEQAKALVQLVRATFDPRVEKRHMLHVNLIPLNPTNGYRGRASQRARIQRFCAVLDEAGIPNTVRVRRGIDISAGCGQLKAEQAE